MERVSRSGRVKTPKKLSDGEELFALQCRIYGLTPVREHVFSDRKYRLDFAWPEQMIGIEIDGGNFNGGHSRGTAYEEFCRKINLATTLGWRVYRFTTAMVTRAEAIDFVRKVLE